LGAKFLNKSEFFKKKKLPLNHKGNMNHKYDESLHVLESISMGVQEHFTFPSTNDHLKGRNTKYFMICV